MKTLQSCVNETLFDGKDKVKSAEARAWLDIFYKYAVDRNNDPIEGNKLFDIKLHEDGLYISQKKGPAALNIQHIKGRKTPTMNIKYFDGRLYVSDNEISSLEGIFAPDCIFKGILIINNDKNLKSFVGCPKKIEWSNVVGQGMSITNNENLESLDGFPKISTGIKSIYMINNDKLNDFIDPDLTKKIKKLIK